jgi:hypothetical protein
MIIVGDVSALLGMSYLSQAYITAVFNSSHGLTNPDDIRVP